VNAIQINVADVIPNDVDETWTPNEIEQLETPEEKRADLDWRIEKGIDSIIDLTQEIKKLDSPEAARKLLEQNKADNSTFNPKPVQNGVLQSQRRGLNAI